MTPEQALRENIRAGWQAMRRNNGRRGPGAVALRRALWADLVTAYSIPNGQRIGAPERWVLAGSVWAGDASE